MTIKYTLVICSICIWVATQATLPSEKECSRFTKCVPFSYCSYAEKNDVEFCNNSDGSYVCCPFFEATSDTEKGKFLINNTMLRCLVMLRKDIYNKQVNKKN